MGETNPEDSESDPDNHGWRGPSRSQQKRDADKIARLGRKLVELKQAELEALSLDPELLQAVATCRTLKKGALSRQLRLIAKLLRERDAAALGDALGTDGKRKRDSVLEEQEYQYYRTRLLAEGDPVLDEFCQNFGLVLQPQARRELRQLVRASRKEPPDAKGQRAKRLLLRKLRELARDREQVPAESGA